MHVYYYKSSVGIFRILPYREGFLLEIDKIMCNTYQDPKDAAEDVKMHATGYYGWDKLKGTEEAPADLSGWTFL